MRGENIDPNPVAISALEGSIKEDGNTTSL